MRKLILPLLCAAAIAPVVASQNCLSTLFASNNSGNLGGAVYFDVNVLNPNGIKITSLETNTSSTAAMSIDVYTLDGGGTGEGNATTGTYTLVSSGSGTGLGVNVPTPIDIVDFPLAPGLHSLALVMDAATQHNYTNGDTGLPWGSGGNQLYSDANIDIRLGGASNVPFTGGIFQPRVWNGTICYEENAECFLMLGLNSANIPVGNDVVLLEPIMVIPMTLTNLPFFDVPNNASLNGFSLYSQALLYNPGLFPNDPMRVSAALRHQIGVNTTSYGSGTGLSLWPIGQVIAAPGSRIEVNFSIN